MSFNVYINTDNAAFEGDPAQEVERILVNLVGAVRGRAGRGESFSDTFPLLDVNGNTVGHAHYFSDTDWQPGAGPPDPELAKLLERWRSMDSMTKAFLVRGLGL